MPLVPSSAERYLRSPRLVPGDSFGARLYAIAWDGHEEAIVTAEIDERGELVSELSIIARARAISALAEGDPSRPAAPPFDEDRAEASGYVGWVERSRGVSTVWVEGPELARTRVFEAFGTAAAPAIAPTKEGVWVAFHHNVREDTGEPDLAKWIALRFVRFSGEVLEPDAEMVDRDRDREGEEQSFEFPTLIVGADGALSIFGRGSHNVYRQDLGAVGFGPRQALSDGAWGCRGRRISAVTTFGGNLLVARRDKKGIEIERLDPPTGGAPSLRPAAIAVSRVASPPSVRTSFELPDDRRILFGDIHQHSAHSDGIGTADEPYLRARWLYGDDFCALTDHESFLGKRIGPGEWDYLQAVADRHDDPGSFATILAYEWTGKMHPGPGHKVVYLPKKGLPIVSRDAVPSGSALLSRLREVGAFAVPHHVGWTGADEAAHDPEAQPVFEICSCHGCYEYADHPLGQRGDLRDQMVDAVLARGHRFGFIACSDGHGLVYHHGVARKRDPFRTGLTAVQARACSREAILDAIRERRCYATSGAKIFLDVRAAQGAPMGSILPMRGSSISVRVRGTALIARIELVGRAGVLASSEPHHLEAELHAEVADAYAYARVTQVDGEMAWSSPIFFDGEA